MVLKIWDKTVTFNDVVRVEFRKKRFDPWNYKYEDIRKVWP